MMMILKQEMEGMLYFKSFNKVCVCFPKIYCLRRLFQFNIWGKDII